MTGEASGPCGARPPRETILCGFDPDEGPPTIWVGREASRLVVELTLEPGGHVGRWTAGFPVDSASIAIEIMPAMGPGGVMVLDPAGRRSSLASSVAEPLDRIRWPNAGPWAMDRVGSKTRNLLAKSKRASARCRDFRPLKVELAAGPKPAAHSSLVV